MSPFSPTDLVDFFLRISPPTDVAGAEMKNWRQNIVDRKFNTTSFAMKVCLVIRHEHIVYYNTGIDLTFSQIVFLLVTLLLLKNQNFSAHP